MAPCKSSEEHACPSPGWVASLYCTTRSSKVAAGLLIRSDDLISARRSAWLMAPNFRKVTFFLDEWCVWLCWCTYVQHGGQIWDLICWPLQLYPPWIEWWIRSRMCPSSCVCSTTMLNQSSLSLGYSSVVQHVAGPSGNWSLHRWPVCQFCLNISQSFQNLWKNCLTLRPFFLDGWKWSVNGKETDTLRLVWLSCPWSQGK